MIPGNDTAGIEHSPESVEKENAEVLRAATQEIQGFDQIDSVDRGCTTRSDQKCTTEPPCPASAMNREHPGCH